jgi:purine-binding chemotaxis protein CheW
LKKEVRSILKNRAIAMAIDPEQDKADSAEIDIIQFMMSTETYGIESSFVREVYPLKDYTPLPGVPSYILGIVNVRGQILPVVDLKKFFNLPQKGLGEMNKVIIIRNEQMEFGIVADVVEGNITVSIDNIMLAPQSITGISEKYIKGITREHVVIIEAEVLLNDKEIIVHEEVS